MKTNEILQVIYFIGVIISLVKLTAIIISKDENENDEENIKLFSKDFYVSIIMVVIFSCFSWLSLFALKTGKILKGNDN